MPTKQNIRTHYTALAHQYDLPFRSLSALTVTPHLLQTDKRSEYIRLQAIPISQTKNTLTVATANPTPKNIKKINDFLGKTVQNIKYVVASMQDISAILASRFETEYAHIITHGRDDLDIEHSASYTFSWAIRIFLGISLFLLLFAAVGNFFYTALWVNAFLGAGTLIIMSYKMGLMLHTWRYLKPGQDIHLPPQTTLPMYTVLIPLLREKKGTIALLLDALNRLDYPPEKLDIKLLLEQDDQKTLAALQHFDLPWYYHILLVPPGTPRSKPRACNYGLQFALGKYLTIFDGEDRPDADQLKKALQKFKASNDNVACVQAALNFYNYRENIITRLFTIEYTYWFDYLIPALDSLRAPVPLGGTSNHFITDVLHKIGGWDPFIGTEDAEIGVRLYRHGYRVEALRSTTYEEANTHLISWFFQRTRWNKGYMQTYLVNMRDPIQMIKQIGPWRFLNFQFFVGGNVFIQLANLPLWIFLLSTIFFYNAQVASLYPKLLYYLTVFNFLGSNLILLITQFIATYNRRLYKLLPFVPLKLLYWMMMSLAGYYAIIELLMRPGYWYKTEHGRSKQSSKTDIPI
ncbi:MAG: hypothetical protein CK424_03870 [Legionella sp.]|nr:MAG: hypothetical protein CK424_03870 [Legionella sp.]